MRVLLDTCALTELRNPEGHLGVKASIALLSAEGVFLSVLTVGEIAKGIALLGEGRKKRGLRTWVATLKSQFGDRILPVDAETASLWGELSARVRQAGHILSTIDGLLAATALRHGLYFMTHHTIGLAATGALIIDPWIEHDESPRTRK